MLKPLSICAALVVSCAGFAPLAAGSVGAQQQEAVLQTIEVPGAAFDLLIAVPKAPAATIDLAGSPEANVMHLVGGRLALAFENGEQMLKAFDALQHPVGAFHMQDRGGSSRIPVAVYLAPKGQTVASAEK